MMPDFFTHTGILKRKMYVDGLERNGMRQCCIESLTMRGSQGGSVGWGRDNEERGGLLSISNHKIIPEL